MSPLQRLALVLGLGTSVVALTGCPNPDDHVLGEVHYVTQDELDELAATGDLIELGEVDLDAEARRRAEAEAEAQTVIDDFVAEHPEAGAALLWEVDAPGAVRNEDGTYTAEPPRTGHPVILHGEGLERRSAAAVIREMEDPVAQREALRMLYDVTPTYCRSLVPAEAEWANLDIPQLTESIGALSDCFAEWRSFSHPFGDDQADGGLRGEQINPPNNTGVCDAPYPIIEGGGNDGEAWCNPTNPMITGWAFYDDLSPIRNQAVRGTCPAMGGASALEYSLRRLEGASLDLSEQSFYSLGKWDMYGENYGDGLPTAEFLQSFADLGWHIDLESSWGYNPSPCRQDLEDERRYTDSCVNYDNDACSESTHQLGLYSAGKGEPIYLWRPVNLADGQYLQIEDASSISGKWARAYAPVFTNALVDAGWGAVVALTVTTDFMNAGTDGFLPDADDSVEGGHAVQLVRFVADSAAPGGMWVVIKNSWGCGWGDGGYGYLSRDWFDDHMKSVTFVRPRRTIFNTPPDVDVTTPSGTVTQPVSGFGNTIQLVASVTDAERGSDCCDITWFSTLDGDLGTGASITATLRGEGTRTIVVTARDEYGALDQDTVVVVLTNQAPDAEITRPAWEPAPGSLLGLKVPVGVHVPYSGVAPDPNDLFQQVPCEQRTWTFTTDQGEAQSFGCASNTAFTALGWVRVTMEASDSGGATGSDTLWVQAVQWPEDALPFAMISSPSQDDFFVSDPGQAWFLKASVASGTGADPTVRWALENPFTHQEFAEIGTGATLRWTPSDFVGFTCGGASVDLVMEATDANGTTVDRLSMYLFYSPC